MQDSTIYTGTYNGYPVEFDGKWMKVLRHYSGTGEFFSSANNWEQAKWSNPDNPQANKYSILDYVKNFKFGGKYTFKLTYPQYKDRTNVWSQAQNPLDIQEVIDGLTKIETGYNGNYWGGLTRSSYSGTFLDGSNPHGNWYFAIASSVSWSGSTNFPGPGAPVNTVELWVKAVDDDMTAVYHRGTSAVPSNVEAKATLGEWDGTSPNPVSRTSMVGLPEGAGQELQVWSNDGTTPRFYSAGQNPGELKHIASQLANQSFETPGEAITWLNSSNSHYLQNENLYPTLDGLWASYDFANPDSFKNDGKLYDISGNKHHMYGGSHDVEDVEGVKAYYFRAVERFRVSGDHVGYLNTGSVTLESMIYADANELTTGDRGTIMQGHIYMSWNKSNRRLSSYWYSASNSGYHEPSLQMEREQWYHLTTVWNYSTGQLKQYIDGVLQNTVNTQVASNNGYISDLKLGMEGSSRQFSGAIAFANVYKKPLTDAEVLRNYEYYSKRIR